MSINDTLGFLILIGPLETVVYLTVSADHIFIMWAFMSGLGLHRSMKPLKVDFGYFYPRSYFKKEKSLSQES